MVESTEHEPGDPAPQSGSYQLLNVFGSPTQRALWLEVGETLPSAPRGFTWRLLEQPDEADEDR